MPNFRETDPSKIAVGFGGTLNLVISLLFLLTTIALMAAPWHAQMIWASTPAGAWNPSWWQAAATGLGFLGGVVAVVVPLRVGARALRQMEF